MRGVLSIALCLILLVSGCKTHQPEQAGLFRQPNWWERRMDRLDTWNRRHGYPINATKTVMLYSLIATGTVAAVIGCWILNGEANKQPGQMEPLSDQNWISIY